MKANEFDRQFDQGENVVDSLDLSEAYRPGHKVKSVTIDFPMWMLYELDREAARLGVSRESIVKVWLADRLQRAS